jgi:hypothetical protein
VDQFSGGRSQTAFDLMGIKDELFQKTYDTLWHCQDTQFYGDVTPDSANGLGVDKRKSTLQYPMWQFLEQLIWLRPKVVGWASSSQWKKAIMAGSWRRRLNYSESMTYFSKFDNTATYCGHAMLAIVFITAIYQARTFWVEYFDIEE